MKIALASARFVNRDLNHNLAQMERFMRYARSQGAELVCFGEAFLQGFDAFVWDYSADRPLAVSVGGEVFHQLRRLTLEIGIDLLFGFLESDGERLYSSCALISKGEVHHRYRRITRGWKEFTKTNEHYCEGSTVIPFSYHGLSCVIALCGDLWEEPQRFALGQDVLFWPVYIDYSPEEWQREAREEYALQAASVCSQTLLINSIDTAHGGCVFFQHGQVAAELPMGKENLLIVDL